MTRKNDAHKEELEGVAQRLRNERPEASPLRARPDQDLGDVACQVRYPPRTAGARRLATAGLTVGLLAAGTGGVIAGHGHGGSSGNAANTQYGGECNISNGSGNVGDNNGAGANNNACNENSFNTITTTETNEGSTVTNNYFSTTVTATPAASSGVLGCEIDQSQDSACVTSRST